MRHNTAVNRSSSALANVFNMEFKYLRKKLVMIPTAQLLNIIMKTCGRNISARFSMLKALKIFPWTNKINALHKIESRYMNTF